MNNTISFYMCNMIAVFNDRNAEIHNLICHMCSHSINTHHTYYHRMESCYGPAECKYRI
jgi:uncharacterized protein YlaI